MKTNRQRDIPPELLYHPRHKHVMTKPLTLHVIATSRVAQNALAYFSSWRVNNETRVPLKVTLQINKQRRLTVTVETQTAPKKSWPVRLFERFRNRE